MVETSYRDNFLCLVFVIRFCLVYCCLLSYQLIRSDFSHTDTEETDHVASTSARIMETKNVTSS